MGNAGEIPEPAKAFGRILSKIPERISKEIPEWSSAKKWWILEEFPGRIFERNQNYRSSSWYNDRRKKWGILGRSFERIPERTPGGIFNGIFRRISKKNERISDGTSETNPEGTPRVISTGPHGRNQKSSNFW